MPKRGAINILEFNFRTSLATRMWRRMAKMARMWTWDVGMLLSSNSRIIN